MPCKQIRGGEAVRLAARDERTFRCTSMIGSTACARPGSLTRGRGVYRHVPAGDCVFDGYREGIIERSGQPHELVLGEPIPSVGAGQHGRAPGLADDAADTRKSICPGWRDMSDSRAPCKAAPRFCTLLGLPLRAATAGAFPNLTPITV